MESISLIIALISAFVATASMIFTVISYKKTVIHDRKQATLEVYNRLQAEVFDNLNTYSPAEIRDICMDTKSSEYKTISGYVARIEHFCVGLNEDIYDKQTFYALAHGYFDGNQLRKRIEPLIEAENQSNKSKELFYNDTLSILQWMEQYKNKNNIL